MTSRSLFPSVRSLLAVVALTTGLLGMTGQAHASKTQESIFQDDRLLQNSGLDVQARALDDLHNAGVDTIHAVINWNSVAPDSDKGSIPDNFNGADPGAYPAHAWDTIDQLVRGAQSRGMDVLLSPAGPAPDWALTCTSAEKRRFGKEKGTCKPDPQLYGDFVTALAKRYDGTFKDENAGGDTLPKVRRWSIWNEPNLNSWISPQIVSIRGKKVSVGAAIYRNLVYAGTKALRANGHRSDQILLGETAPIGLGTIRTSPVTFYQTLFCIDAKGKKLKGAAATNAGCNGAKRLDVNGVAHHPYGKGASQAPTTGQRKGDVTTANMGDLEAVLKQGAHVRMVRSRLPIFYTEFGVSSRPPAARGKGVPLATQALYINEAEYLAYLDKNVRSFAQFQLEDDTALLTKTFQTGLRFASGKDKPSFAAYEVPLFVQNKGSKFTVWGGVRSANSGSVQILNGGKVVKTVSLRRGYFLTTVPKASGTWQLSFQPPGGGEALKSRVASATKLPKGF